MRRNRQFDFTVKFISLVALIFATFNSARAETVQGKFFNGVTYIGEHSFTESRNADGMRVNTVTIKLKIENEENPLRYTYVADDLPTVKANDMGFLSIIVNSGGMEGSVTYNYVVPDHGALISIGTVQTTLHLGKIESIDVQPNKNIPEDMVDFLAKQIVTSNPSALSDPSNSYSAATLLLLGRGKYLALADKSNLSALIGSKEISDDPVLLRAIKSVIGDDARADGSIQAPTKKLIVSNKAYFFKSPRSSDIEKSYLIKGDVVTLLTKSADGRYWLADYVSAHGGKMEKWLRCEDIDYCR
jgi:hypothetical protein